MRWSVITTSKEKDGLGINRVIDTVFFLLCKWLCGFHYEKSPLWKCIILAKYDQSFVGEIPMKGKYCSLKAPWLSIIKGVDWFISHIHWKINEGASLSFRKTLWHENSPLHLCRPRLSPSLQSKMVL